MATYVRTGRIFNPDPAYTTWYGQVSDYPLGEQFTATLSSDAEAWLLQEGVITKAPRGASPGGSGGSAASPIVRKFPFAFDTPDLVAGVAVYTPAIGDVLLDAWFDIVTAWDNGPRADIGAFASTGASGLFAIGGLPIAMGPSSPEIERDGLRLGPPAGGGQWLSLAGSSAWNGQRFAPAVWIDTIPLKLVVSGDGTSGFSGSITPATQGAAVLHLVTATPA